MRKSKLRLLIGAGTWYKNLLLTSAAHFFAKKLEGFRGKHVMVQLDLIYGLRDQEHYRGAAYQNSPRSYRIELDKALKPINMIRTLAHEMIHVNQWLTDKMQDVGGRRHEVRWGTRKYRPSDLGYWKHPWEIQAHRKEKKLYKEFALYWRRGW